MADMQDIFPDRRIIVAPTTPIDRLIMPPQPGEGWYGPIIPEVFSQIPIPRLPLPRIPVPTPRGPRVPIPIPIPFPDDILFGDGGCNATNPCCRGQHLDKKTKSRCVSNRSMNPLNPRALKRATRRLSRFDKMARNAKKEMKKLCR